MRVKNRWMLATLGLVAALTPAYAVANLSFEQLLSVVFFEDENAYQYPTPLFCHLVALTDPNDTCDVSFRVVEPATCKVEIIRQYRVTYGQGKGREFMRAKDVVTIANIDMPKVAPPLFDPARRTARTTLVGDLDINRHEGYEYSYLLDEKGNYSACRMSGMALAIPEEECVKVGTVPAASSRQLPLVYSGASYNRSMAAVRWLQTSFCPAGGERT